MRSGILLVAVSAVAFAQSVTTTFTTDLNGQRVAASTSTSSDHSQTELSPSINGQRVPLQQVHERVLRSDASGKVTERTVLKYDPTGRLVSTERVLTDEQTKPGGNSTVKTTTYQSDINGGEHETERRLTETRVAGATTTADTTIERPSIDGALAIAEKRNLVSSKTGTAVASTEKIYRPSDGGGLYEAVRQVTSTNVSGNQTVQKSAEYEINGIAGQLQLKNQTVATTIKKADGSEITQVNLYAPSVDGVVQPEGAPQQIKEQQIVTRSKAPDGSVTETLGVRRPTISDPTHLGEVQNISQTVCQGKCGPP